MKRSDSSKDSNSTCSEAKRPKMDVPPPNCLRTRRPGMTSIRGRGRGSSNTSEDQLGSLSGQSLVATDVNTNDEAEKGKTEMQPSDVQNGPSQDGVAKDTTATADTKPKEKQVKSPKMLLNEYYAKLHVKTDKSNYITIQHDKIVKFTSVFTSPSTGEQFMSGRLKEIEFYEEDGVVWYANKQSATTAAAARAMDCLAFRVNMQNKSSGDDAPFCLDAPYLKDQGPIVPKVLMDKLPAVQIKDQDVAVAKVDDQRSSVQNQQSNVDNSPTRNDTMPSKAAAAADSTRENVPAAKASPSKQPKSPRQLLNEHYAKLHTKAEGGNYTTIKHDKVQVVKFASVFTCPQSGEHFAGGRLKNELYSNEDGVTWYANIKLAKTSAAGRAIDCFTFRKFSEQKSHEGLPDYTCLDPPYLNDSGPDLPPCFQDKLLVKHEKVLSEHTATKCDEDAKQKQSHTVQSSNELGKKQVDAKPTTSKSDTNQAERKCPRQELNGYYNTLLVQNQMSQLKSYYVVWEHRFAKVARYTCIFVCPISLEAFACGHLPENNEEAILHDSLFWYNSKQLARNAAAAKALDCFAYRDLKGSNEKHRLRCLDAPYIQGKAPPLLSLPDGLALPTSTLDVKKKSSSGTIVGPHPAPISSVANGSPNHVLTSWYSTYWRRISKGSFKLAHPTEKARLPDKDSFTTWSNLQIREQATIKLYTSVFVCPWSGERFLSGKLVDKQMQYMEQNFELGVHGSDEGFETRKLVWYRTKKDAVNAAAGRALDSFQFRFLSNNAVPILNTPRYCVEPPDGFNERDIIHRLTGVMEVYTEMSRPIYFKLPWMVVPIEERVQIRYIS